jgi:uncharacterized membrane protein
MITHFMKDPLTNTLAIVVLLALLVAWFTSLIMSLRTAPISTNKGGYASLLPLFSLLGIPATLDLLQTKGVTFFFAAAVFVVFVLNVSIPILRMRGKISHPVVDDWYKWAVPVAVAAGLIVAGYLTFVESTGAKVACGPSGGCTAVQTSRYAILFNVLPVGVLGLAGYIAILLAWLVWQFGPERWRNLGALSIWGMCIFGVLFSIYLTFLEPFVIGATCMWCISSAVLMIDLLLISTPPAQQAFSVNEDDLLDSDL